MIEAERQHKGWLILGLFMAVSLWVHILGLTLFRYYPPQAAIPTSPPLFIEIELPDEKPKPRPVPPTPLKEPESNLKNDSKPPGLPAAYPQDKTEPAGLPPLDDTISLESRTPQYLSYLGQVKAGIRTHWIFPSEAMEKRQSGSLTAIFTLDKTGRLQRIVVVKSSGHPSLDHAALEAIRGAAPFPPFPEHINLEMLNIRANFDYRIRVIAVK